MLAVLQFHSFKRLIKGTCKQRRQDKIPLKLALLTNQSAVEFEVCKFSRNSVWFMQRWLYINFLLRIFVTFTGIKVGFISILHSSSLLGSFSFFSHLLSSALPMQQSNTANKWIKSHKLSCCSHCTFRSWIVHINSIPIYRDWSLNWTGEFTHLCFQPIFESPYNHNSRLSNESQFNRFNSAENFYTNTNLHFLFLKLAMKEY